MTVESTMTVQTVDATVASVQGTGPLKVGDVVKVFADANVGDTLLVAANDEGSSTTFVGKLDRDDPRRRSRRRAAAARLRSSPRRTP